MVDLRAFATIALLMAGHAAAGSPKPPELPLPLSVPCVGDLRFTAGNGLLSSLRARTGAREISPETADGGILIPLDPKLDCGQTLTLTVGTTSESFAIQAAAAPPSSPESSSASPGSKDLRDLKGEISSLRDAVLMYGGVAATIIFFCCAATLGFLVLQWRNGSTLYQTPQAGGAVAQPQLPDLERLVKGAIRDEISLVKPQLVPSAPEKTQSGRSVAAPRSARSATPPPIERETLIREEPPSVSSGQTFEQLYTSMSSGDNAMLPELKSRLMVNFKDPEAIDRDPDISQPLVKDANGTLMIFALPGYLPEGRYYLAPSLEFQGSWSETHTRKWRSVFDFTSPRATNMVKAAIVEAEGSAWVVAEKGVFS